MKNGFSKRFFKLLVLGMCISFILTPKTTDADDLINTKWFTDKTLAIPDAPADSKTTGDRFVALEDDVNDIKSTLNSGGIYGNIVEPTWVTGAIVLTSGAISYSSSEKSCVTEEGKPFIVEPGTIIHLTDAISYKFRGWYAATGAIPKWYTLRKNYDTADIIIPSDRQRRIVLMIARQDGGDITTDELAGKIQIILPKCYPNWDNGFYKDFSVYEHFDLNGALPTTSSGVASLSPAYNLTHFIPVKSGMTIATNLTSAGGYIIAFYNSKLEFVEGVRSGDTTYTVPSDGFVRFSGSAEITGYYAYFSSLSIPDQTNQELVKINNTLTSDVTGTGYMQTALERITAQLKAKSSLGNIPVFGFSTDQHIRDETDATKTLPVLRGLQVLSKLTHEYPFDFICLGGDACDSGSYASTVDLILDECVTVQKPLYDAWCPVIPITGNHDAMQNNEDITGEMLFNVHFKRIANSGFLSGWDNSHTNGYWDSVAHKIRFIFLDDTVRKDYGSKARNNALMEMLSGVPEGYNIVIFSHHPLSNELEDTKWQNKCSCQNILAAYATRIICCICGHNHADVSETSAGILYIGTTMAQYGTDLSGNTATLNSETETAFDIFVIDQENKKIYAFRYGKGSDRDWSYTLD